MQEFKHERLKWKMQTGKDAPFFPLLEHYVHGGRKAVAAAPLLVQFMVSIEADFKFVKFQRICDIIYERWRRLDFRRIAKRKQIEINMA